MEHGAALVTGAGKRIGRIVAMRLADEGLPVAVHFKESRREAEDLVAAIRSGGGIAVTVAADLRDESQLELMVREAEEGLGPLGLLVNSASVWARIAPADLTSRDFDEAIAVNLRAPFLLALIVAKGMKARAHGSIINILDWSVNRPYPDYLAYGIAKAGLLAATRGLARSFAPEVRVNGIAPGAVLLPEGIESERAERIRKAIPLGRIGSPEDVAAAVVYLMRAEYATGTILTLDGGRNLK
jgi:NAD(P)-dependent dehydrogenase (short-subunit alcohol dehydrogenase family)